MYLNLIYLTSQKHFIHFLKDIVVLISVTHKRRFLNNSNKVFSQHYSGDELPVENKF